MTIEEKYQELCVTDGDIAFHLPTLRQYADGCDHVTEMGVRGCVSLHAFLSSRASKVVAYDINNVPVPVCDKLTFICADVLKIEIEPTDFLFIDTLHTYEQLRAELERHANKAKMFIGIHDTELFGDVGEGGASGINAAWQEFLSSNPQWSVCYQTDVNNGLTILKRQSA